MNCYRAQPFTPMYLWCVSCEFQMDPWIWLQMDNPWNSSAFCLSSRTKGQIYISTRFVPFQWRQVRSLNSSWWCLLSESWPGHVGWRMRTVRFPYLGSVSCLEGKTYIQKLYFICIHWVGSNTAGLYLLLVTKQVLSLNYIHTWRYILVEGTLYM